MGEIADSLINGEFDCETGEYLGEPCGYPRTFKQMNDIKQSTARSAVRGVVKYVNNSKLKAKGTVQIYFKDVLNSEEKNFNKQCVIIQDDFHSFRTWLLKNKELLANS